MAVGVLHDGRGCCCRLLDLKWQRNSRSRDKTMLSNPEKRATQGHKIKTMTRVRENGVGCEPPVEVSTAGEEDLPNLHANKQPGLSRAGPRCLGSPQSSTDHVRCSIHLSHQCDVPDDLQWSTSLSQEEFAQAPQANPHSFALRRGGPEPRRAATPSTPKRTPSKLTEPTVGEGITAVFLWATASVCDRGTLGPRQPPSMFGILGAVNVDNNTKTYGSFEELFAALKARMQKDGYKVVKSRTHRNKVGGTYEKGSEVVRCDLVCDRGGQPYKCTATQLKTTTKKTDCPWKAKAVNRKTMGAWLLTIICDEHNHEPRTPDPPTDDEDADAEGDADVQETSASVYHPLSLHLVVGRY